MWLYQFSLHLQCPVIPARHPTTLPTSSEHKTLNSSHINAPLLTSPSSSLTRHLPPLSTTQLTKPDQNGLHVLHSKQGLT